ncbi:MAG: ATP-grasp fold amidoligase family protein [Balneolaceae bacterium]|nr:ATP-grasp fold amidoligase family protein [Balneolaceae bacterium]
MVKYLLRKLFWGFFRHLLPDELYLKIRYWIELDEWPDLNQPRKFTEKIQYLKLHEQSGVRKKVANRTTAREYVKEKVGRDYLIPLIGIYDELTREIWDSLPNQFVLKANHGSAMLKIVFDKSQEEYHDLYHQTEKWKKFDYAEFGRERVYDGIPRTIVAEKLLLDKDGSIPPDYKFFCFHGRVEIIQVDIDRFNNQKRKLVDRDFTEIKATILHPKYKEDLECPENLDEAIDLAEKLSADFNFIRVDLYLLENKIYVGELTNYPGNGFQPFQPESMEYKVGDLLQL